MFCWSKHDEACATQDGKDICLGQRFFVYELPEQLYGGTFECLQGQWGTEVLLHEYFRHNCNTPDPQEADWFYVPLHATCVYVKLNENVSEELVFNMDNVSNHFIWDPMMDFLKASRYFHRYEGADHIFLFADGQGPRIWDSHLVQGFGLAPTGTRNQGRCAGLNGLPRPRNPRLRPASKRISVSLTGEPLSHLERAFAPLRGREAMPFQLEGLGDPGAHRASNVCKASTATRTPNTNYN